MSVIISTRNRAWLLKRALMSVAYQDVHWPETVEVCVVNDGGSELPQWALSQWAGHPLKYRTFDERLGLSSARNCGLDMATGRYVAFLDDDDIFRSNHLKYALAKLRSHGVTLCYQPVECDYGPWKTGPQPYGSALALPSLLVANRWPIIGIVHGESSARFDEELSVCEDWDYLLQLAVNMNAQIVNGSECTSIYDRWVALDRLTSLPKRRFAEAYCKIIARWPCPFPLVQRLRESVTSWHATEGVECSYESMLMGLDGSAPHV